MKVKFWITLRSISADGNGPVHREATLDIPDWDKMYRPERDAQMLTALSEMGFEWGVSEEWPWNPKHRPLPEKPAP